MGDIGEDVSRNSSIVNSILEVAASAVRSNSLLADDVVSLSSARGKINSIQRFYKLTQDLLGIQNNIEAKIKGKFERRKLFILLLEGS